LEFDWARVCDTCYDILEKELGNVDSLKGKFKKSLSSRTTRNFGQSHQNQRLKQATGSTGSASGSGSEGAQMSGYLRKKQKNGAKWKRLWFVLRDGILYAFKAPEDLLPADTFSIMGYKLEILSEKNIELYEGESGGLVFQLAHPGNETLIFCADNDNICEKWMAAINKHAVNNSS